MKNSCDKWPKKPANVFRANDTDSLVKSFNKSQDDHHPVADAALQRIRTVSYFLLAALFLLGLGSF